ncbi:hypothetical protein [Vibrio parahaemolyticus]|uniref:hypothetical protein n=1 Tax=Vibrio parahaemolyticus TaxID=670 RepID=UPI00301C21C0
MILLFLSYSIPAIIMIFVTNFIETNIAEKANQYQAYTMAVLITLAISYYIGVFEKNKIKNKYQREINILSNSKDILSKEIDALKTKVIESELEHAKQLSDLQKKTSHHLICNSKTLENESLWCGVEDTIREMESYHERTYLKIKTTLK